MQLHQGPVFAGPFSFVGGDVAEARVQNHFPLDQGWK